VGARPTAAEYRVRGVREVQTLLNRLAAAVTS